MQFRVSVYHLSEMGKTRVCSTLERYAGILKQIENAFVTISIEILEQTYYSGVRDLNPAIYMLINFSLKSQGNTPLAFREKHFIKPQWSQCKFIQCHSYEVYKFVISRRDNVR